jgi:PST family polysaccharide transporter
MTAEPRHTRAIALIGFAQGLILFFGLVRWKVVALMLGPGGVGVASVIDQVAQIALNLGMLSLPMVAMRSLAWAQEARPGAIGGMYRAFLGAILAGTTVTAAGAAAIATVWPSVIGRQLAAYAPALLLGLVAVPFTASATLNKAVLAALGRYRDAALAMTAGAAGLAFAAWAGIRLGGFTGMYVGTALTSLVVALVMRALVAGSRVTRGAGGPASLRALAREHPEVPRLALSLYVVSCSTALSYGVMRFVVLRHQGEVAAGLLAAALAVAMAMRIVLGEATAQYLMPIISRPTPKAERAAEMHAYMRSLAAMLLLLALALCLFPREVLVVLYSRRFTAAAATFGLFVFAEATLALAATYQTLLVGFDDRRGYLTSLVGGQAVLVAGVLALVPTFGLPAAAWSHVAGGCATLALIRDRVRRAHDGPRGWRPVAPALYVLAAIAVAVTVGRVASASTPAMWALKAAVAVALAAPLLRLVGSPLALLRSRRATIDPVTAATRADEPS